jgi:tuftelin-interacting protein 11
MDLEDSEADSSPDEEEEEEQYEETTDANAEEDLAPVPGLAPPPSNPLEFAPRATKGRGGIGSKSSATAGIGAQVRAGLGSSASTSAPITSAPLFASATAASIVVLGELSNRKRAGGTSDSIEESTSGSASPMTGAATPRGGLGSHNGIGSGIGMRAGIGGAGIGQRPQTSLLNSLRNELTAAQISSSDSPLASRSTKEEDRPRRSFLPSAAPSPTAVKASTTMSNSERQHFAKLATSGSLGLKMLEKMGWKSGTGLGADEQGIVTPIGEGTKLRQKGAGLGPGERSAGAKAEGKRSVPCYISLPGKILIFLRCIQERRGIR